MGDHAPYAHTPLVGVQTPAHSGYGGSSAWNVGSATPAMLGAQTPLSPAYDPNHNSHSTYSHNSHQAATPSYHHQQQNDDQNVMSSNASESEQGDNYEKAMQQDPYYFIVEHALLSLNGEDVIIQSVDKTNNVCSVLYPSRNQQSDNVPMSNIMHSVTCESSTKCKVVWGKLRGEIGSLIGIDNEEAVVQLSATTEVTIIPKKLVVVYVEP